MVPRFLEERRKETNYVYAMEIQMNFTDKPRKLKQCNYIGSIHVSVLLHEQLNNKSQYFVLRQTAQMWRLRFSTQSYSNSETRCHNHMRFRQPEMPDVLLI
jgi:hypothetical protein